MQKIYLLSLFTLLSFQYSFGRDINADSLTAIRKSKVHIGFYVMPTFSFNIGKKTAPKFYDPADCFCDHSYKELKEFGNIGYSFGFEIEFKKISKRISISSGINFEEFHYTGTAEESFKYPFSSPTVREVSYFYEDYYIDFPLLVHHQLLANNKSRLNALMGFAVGTFLSEVNSYKSPVTNEWEKNEASTLTALGIAGVDYFYGTKIIFNIGCRFTTQIFTTPEKRRLASAGIKVGVFY